MKMTETLRLLLPISVVAATLSVFIAVLVIRCYLRWKRQHKKEQIFAEGPVPKLVLSSQPVDFLVPLLIQDRLEEEEEVDQFDIHYSVSGASSEDIGHEPEKSQTGERKVRPLLARLHSEASVLDRNGQRVNLRCHAPRSTKRGESLFFDDGAESFHSSDESLLPRCSSAGPQPRPLRRGSRADSLKSLSRESLSEESSLPDPTPHMLKSLVSSINTTLPKSKLTKQRRKSANEVSYTGSRRSRRNSQVSRKRGKITLKMTFAEDLRSLEVHLINATELPLRHGRMLDVFARLSLKTPSKRRGERLQSKLLKKTCNPIFDERFVFKNLHLAELKKGRLKIRLFDRHGVSRYEPIGETVFSLCDESIMRGDKLCRDLSPQFVGELQFSLCHEATSSHLKVIIMRLKDLPKSVKNPSVAVELTHNRKEEVIQKHQTKAGKKDLTINEEFSFEVATNSSCTLENFGVQFTIFQHEFMHRNEVIGHVRLGLDAPFPSEINHWKAVTLSPHKPIQGWHKLHGPL